jgi:hypothetical protein
MHPAQRRALPLPQQVCRGVPEFGGGTAPVREAGTLGYDLDVEGSERELKDDFPDFSGELQE